MLFYENEVSGHGVLSFLVILISSSYFLKQRAYESSEGLDAGGIDREITPQAFIRGMLKKAASGVLPILPCSRTGCTLRASKRLRPCWSDFFEHSLRPLIANSSRVRMRHA